MRIKGNYIDIENEHIFAAEVEVIDGKIASITPLNETVGNYILPGFIDAHIHIESSMVMPSAFAKVAVLHGTVATVSDPHEIANVLGMQGVNLMIENSKLVPFHFFFGAPSCVPATTFETAGAELNADDINTLMQSPDIWYLSEVMNYPAVIHSDAEMMRKLDFAKKSKKPIDGHAPGVTGNDLKTYINAGISTDHECVSYQEGLEKLELGMKVLIREGSAAKNFEALIALLEKYPKQIMFCSDDKHPDDLMVGHINQLVLRALAKGHKLFDVLYAACIAPAKHYKLPVGLLKVGDSADFIVVDSITNFNVIETYIKGTAVAQHGISHIPEIPVKIMNRFNCDAITTEQIQVKSQSKKIKVIEAYNQQLVTGCVEVELPSVNGFLQSNTALDVIKIVVVNRYFNAPPSVAFIKNFGFKTGAIAGCIAHDSHNIVAIGVEDQYIVEAINAVIKEKGGISIASNSYSEVLPLPIAGIISPNQVADVGHAYQNLHIKAKELGCQLDAPYMSLSFMALLVIPSLKISDKGLFNGTKFEFTSLEALS